MKVIIVTGGIGSGKSAVCGMLKRRGIPVYDSDSSAKALYEKYPELKKLIVPDIFSRPDCLKRLEDAVYPLLMDDFRAWCGAAGSEWVAFESAIVLQKSFFDNFGDYVMLVDAPEELRLERAVQRGGDRQDILRRMQRQELQHSNPRISVVVNNGADLAETEAAVEAFLKETVYKNK